MERVQMGMSQSGEKVPKWETVLIELQCFL